jgi:hypothetical protein
VAEPESVAESRFAGLGQAIRLAFLVTAAVVVAVGLLGAIVAWAGDNHFSSTMAITYYLVGCILFIVGMLPAGGFSMLRGTITRRRPIGSGPKPSLLLGLGLIGLGVLLDFTHPF